MSKKTTKCIGFILCVCFKTKVPDKNPIPISKPITQATIAPMFKGWLYITSAIIFLRF